MFNEVEFAAEDGTILRGRHYTGQDEGDRPVIVMAHGFSGVSLL